MDQTLAKFVYILSDYDEHGAENMCATLDSGSVDRLIMENWPDPAFNEEVKEAVNRVRALLAEQFMGPKPGHYALGNEWGSITLDVVELR